MLPLGCTETHSPPLHATLTLPSGLTPRITRFFQPTLASLARTLAFAGALALGLTAQRGHAATIIFDNLNAPLPNADVGVLNNQYAAQAFTTTATGFVLTAVELQLYNQNGTTGGYELQLWDTTGASGRPGAQVGAALYTGLAQNLIPGSLLSVTGLNRVLAANTKYYLVAAGTSLTDVPDPDPSEPPQPGYLGWNMTDTATSGLSGAYSSSNSGTTWTGPFSYYGYMKIEAGSGGASVPDAGHTPAALGVILAGLATLRRRLRP